MQAQIGIGLAGVGQDADVGDDHRVGPGCDRSVDGPAPGLVGSGAGEGVDSHQNLGATGPCEGDSVLHLGGREVQAWEIASVRLVAQAAIDAVSPCLDGGA